MNVRRHSPLLSTLLPLTQSLSLNWKLSGQAKLVLGILLSPPPPITGMNSHAPLSMRVLMNSGPQACTASTPTHEASSTPPMCFKHSFWECPPPLFKNILLLCNLSWPQTHYVVQADLGTPLVLELLYQHNRLSICLDKCIVFADTVTEPSRFFTV